MDNAQWVSVIIAAIVLITIALTGAAFDISNSTPATVPETTTEPQSECKITYTIYDVPLSRELQIYTQELCETCNVPFETVLSVMFVESSFNENAVNGNCYGLMQVNSIHSEVLAKLGITDLKDPKQNIEAGILILSTLFKQYDETTALMAYNCGRAKANQMIESGITSTSYTRKVKSFTETLQVKERIYIFE